MTIPQILGYTTQLLTDWGAMPYIQAGLLVMSVVGMIVFIRRLWLGS